MVFKGLIYKTIRLSISSQKLKNTYTKNPQIRPEPSGISSDVDFFFNIK